MDWHTEVKLAADLTPDQLDEVAARFAFAFYHSDGKMLRIGADLQSTDYRAALIEAAMWLQDVAVPAVLRLAPNATVLRLVVESAAARGAQWAVGTKEAAELLGISPTRLRQLQKAAGFPEPVADPAAGSVWRRDEIEKFGRDRVLDKGGRPRKAVPEG